MWTLFKIMSSLFKRKVFVGATLLMAIICAVYKIQIGGDEAVVSGMLLIGGIENKTGPRKFSGLIAPNKSHLVHSVISLPRPKSKKKHKSWKARQLMVRLSSKLPTLTPDVIQGVKTFMFFIGYGRSGHSIVGSILDAHPHIVISHELRFLELWSFFNEKATPRWTANLYNIIYQKSLKDTLAGGRRNAKSTSKGYTLAIGSLWQGKFDKYIQVLGDKSGGSATLEYMKDRSTFRAHYIELRKRIGVPIKVLHVVRNPYDVIVTDLLYFVGYQSSKGEDFVVGVKKHAGNITIYTTSKEDTKINDYAMLKSKVKIYFDKSRAVMELIELIGRRNVLVIHLRDLIHNPRSTILSISSFLGVDAADKYLQLCEEKVYKTTSPSRNLVVWPLELRMTVEHRMKDYEMLQGYNFTSD